MLLSQFHPPLPPLFLHGHSPMATLNQWNTGRCPLEEIQHAEQWKGLVNAYQRQQFGATHCNGLSSTLWDTVTKNLV